MFSPKILVEYRNKTWQEPKQDGKSLKSKIGLCFSFEKQKSVLIANLHHYWKMTGPLGGEA